FTCFSRSGCSRSVWEPWGPSVDSITYTGTDWTLTDAPDRARFGRVGLRGEEGVDHLLGDLRRRQTQAEGEHVRVVPATGAGRGLGVGAQRGPDTSHLVGRDRHTGSRPAAHQPPVGRTARHRLAHAAADVP